MELPKSPQRILVVQTGNIREVLASMPFLVLLRTRFPKAELACLVEENAAEMIHGHWALDRLLTARQAWQRSYFQASLLRKHLRRFAPDLAFDLHTTFRSGLAMWMSRAPHRIGSGGNFSSRFTNTISITSSATDLVQQFLSLLEVVGVEAGSIHFDIPEWERDRHVAAEICRQQKMAEDFVLMSVCDGSSLWQHAEYTHLVHYLKSQWNLPTLLVAETPDAMSLTETVSAITGSSFVAGYRFALSELAALTQRATAYIGPDTNLFAIAAAAKTPAVATRSDTNFDANFLSACDELLNEITRQREQLLPFEIDTRKIAAA